MATSKKANIRQFQDIIELIGDDPKEKLGGTF